MYSPMSYARLLSSSVALEDVAGRTLAHTDVLHRGAVEDDVDAAKTLGQRVAVADVGEEELDGIVAVRLLEIEDLALVVVDADDPDLGEADELP